MKKLIINELYTRKDVNQIFAPDIEYTGHGTWGQHGFIHIKSKPGDFIFYVNLNNKSFEHEFDEYITSDGVLTWQSQPRHSLEHPLMKSLIEHDHTKNNVYLFVKSKQDKQYLFMGKLAYLVHDNEKENPVHFRFSILSWDENMQKKYEENGFETKSINTYNETQKGILSYHKKPDSTSRKNGVKTGEFIARHYDFADINEKNKVIGNSGELLVVKYEKQRLLAEGREDLASKIEHTSLKRGDGSGFDIRSFESNGSDRYIEVKTTTLPIYSPFYITPNELRFSEENPETFYLYRIFNYDRVNDSGDLYVLEGDLSSMLELIPTNFQATIKK